tara:strand:- start:1161 stop:4427 length:3267 start_codon:yes stop_codon:yes gene_type:complete
MATPCKTINLFDVPTGKQITARIEEEHKSRDWKAAAAEAERRDAEFVDPEDKPDKIISDARISGFIFDGKRFADSNDITTAFHDLAVFNDRNRDGLVGLELVGEDFLKALKKTDINPVWLNPERKEGSHIVNIGQRSIDLGLYEIYLDKPESGTSAEEFKSDLVDALKRSNFFKLADLSCDPGKLGEEIEELYDLGIKALVALETGPDSGLTMQEIREASKSKEAAEAAAAKLKAIEEEAAAREEAVAEASKNEKSLKEQCIMLATIFQLAGLHIASFPNKKLPFFNGYEYNAVLPVEGEPFGFINKLTQSPSFRNFFEAENKQLAHLQPMIRLFKVAPNDDGKEVELEFPFDTFASKDDVSEIYSNRNRRGFGANIKNFTFAYDGSNPFSVKKSIKAKLSIKANNFSELLRPRGSSGLRYIDLALKTGKAVKEKTGDPELDFRIKALIGLSLPPRTERISNYSDIQGAVNDNFVTLNLTPVTHQFNFDETGAVEFTVDYYAYIEEYFDKPRMNIFSDTSINKRLIERDLAFKTLAKDCGGDNAEKISEFKQQESEKIKSDKLEALKFLTSKMIESGILYYLNLTVEEFNTIAEKGPFFKLGDITSKVSKNSTAAANVAADMAEAWKELEPEKTEEESEGILDSIADAGEQIVDAAKSYYDEYGALGVLAAVTSPAVLISNLTAGPAGKKLAESIFPSSEEARPVSPQNKTIAFFFLGDLIDLILKEMQMNFESLTISDSFSLAGGSSVALNQTLLSEERKKIKSSIEQLKKMRIVLGPMKLINHADTNQSANISFADLPISLSYFNEWLTEKMLAKDSAEYTLTQFITNLMNNLVKTFLNDDSCYDFNIKQKTRVFQSTITSYRQFIKNNEERDKQDDITRQMNKTSRRLNIDKASRPVLNISGHRTLASANLGADRENHFFIFYAGRTTPSDMMTGNKKDDEDGGIYHYILGRDVGIVKNISLSKTDSPGLKEVRFEKEGYQGLSQLREIYDVNIDSFLNVHAFPGTYIFVEPRGFSPDLGKYDKKQFDLTDLGIGGYHMIIGSEHEIAPGTMKSTLKAKWVQGLDADNKENQDNNTSPKKCKSIY